MVKLNPGFFVAHPGDARDLFRSSVETVEIEISSYCNRRCGFCPNSFLDRLGPQRFMDDALFTSIVSQLGTLDWSGFLSFHRYNEPLADRDYFLARLNEAHIRAPSARMRLFTNGDYLTRDYLDAIYDGGCRMINGSVYLQEGKPYADEEMTAAVLRRIGLLGLRYRWHTTQPGYHVAEVEYRDMIFFVTGQNYHRPLGNWQAMSNRAGSLGFDPGFQRVDPCLKPITEMQIELDGTLFPCCEFRSDYPAHQAYALGRLRPEDDLVAVWASAIYTKWRRDLFSFEVKRGACGNCRAPGVGDSAENRRIVAEVRRHWIDTT